MTDSTNPSSKEVELVLEPCPHCNDSQALQLQGKQPPLLAKTVHCKRCGFRAPFETWQARTTSVLVDREIAAQRAFDAVQATQGQNYSLLQIAANVAANIRGLPQTRARVDSVAPTVDLDESKTFANTHFQFGFCVHSMMKPNCPGCLQGHASRLEQQLRKLESSTALPIRERIDRVLREHLTHWQEHYRGVPPTVEGWINNALHSIMWGIERDLPLPGRHSP